MKKTRLITASGFAATATLLVALSLTFAAPALAAGGCKTTSSSTNDGANTASTSIYWCWNGTNVTSYSISSSTSTGIGYTFVGWPVNSYCCLNQPTWHLRKVAEFDSHPSGMDYVSACLRNEFYLHGDGTYTTNPGHNLYHGSFTYPGCS